MWRLAVSWCGSWRNSVVVLCKEKHGDRNLFRCFFVPVFLELSFLIIALFAILRPAEVYLPLKGIRHKLYLLFLSVLKRFQNQYISHPILASGRCTPPLARHYACILPAPPDIHRSTSQHQHTAPSYMVLWNGYDTLQNWKQYSHPNYSE